jgi:hypothetical protein
VIIFLTVYGLGFYHLGKNSSLVNILKVKGAFTEKSTIETPLDSPVPFADTQTSTITASFVKLCPNTVFGFEVSYPKDWFTTYNTEDQKCTFFAPYSFIVPYETSNFLAPIRLEIIGAADWLGNVRFYENPNDFQNIVSSENIEINGKGVKKIEATSTGQGSIERGFAKTTYLVFHEQNPIVVTYQQLEKNENVEANKKVVEEIVSSLRYF